MSSAPSVQFQREHRTDRVIADNIEKPLMTGPDLWAMIQSTPTVKELLQLIAPNSASKQGNVYEKVWDLIIKSGCCPQFPNNTYTHFYGNINTCRLTKIRSLEEYVGNISVFSKNEGGASDITMQHKITEKWIFISSKLHNDPANHCVKAYEVQDILAVTNVHSYKYKNVDIYLLVRDKKSVLDTIRRSHGTNDYISKNIHHILDIQDLEACYQQFRRAITGVAVADIHTHFDIARQPLTLYFHQQMTVSKLMAQVRQGQREFLLGLKARSGKTYTVGGLCSELYKYKCMEGITAIQVMIVTPAPTETMSQFTDDLFRKFSDFIGFNVHEIKRGSSLLSTQFDQSKSNIIIVSKQMLDDYVCGNRVIAGIRDLQLDLMVFDENHFHGTTAKSKQIFEAYACPQHTIRVYLTATYAKALRTWNIPTECQYYWDVEDEKMCKARDVTGLMAKHGEAAVRQHADIDDPMAVERALKSYDRMPELHIITTMMDQERYHTIKARIKDTSFGFSCGTLLSTTKNGKNFQYPDEVDSILKYITGQGTVTGEAAVVRDKMAPYERIKHIRTECDSRAPYTHLYFVAFGQDKYIDDVSRCLEARMMHNRVLMRYDIMIVNSKKGYKCADIKSEIGRRESKAKADGKVGLILIAGSQLTLGVTLPLVDIVVLMNDTVSGDKLTQMMYRCMTESVDGSKKTMGFVVDLNPNRVLYTLIEYPVAAATQTSMTIEQKMVYVIQNDLIHVDCDLFYGKENKSNLVERLMQIWKVNPTHHIQMFLKRMENTTIELDTPDQRILNKYFTTGGKDSSVNIKVQFDTDSPDALPTGTTHMSSTGTTPNATDEDDEADESDDSAVHVSLTKDVLPFIIPLIVILTWYARTLDILEMLQMIKHNPELMSVFRDQSFIWWNRPDILCVVEPLIRKYVEKDSSMYGIVIQFKMSMESLIDRPQELLELIDSCLKPKQKEKQENGEVFTPMKLVFEMLEKLDNHYTKVNSCSIFTVPELKWFDPASGMGNFPVAVYLKLMEGLKPQFPRDDDRKKHIIENMLYMSELNKKNVFICRQIFNFNGQYTMNLHEGDTLKLDVSDTWGIAPREFDVVLGNPPYNKGGIRSHTGEHLGEKNETIWTKFIERSFESWLKPDDGFLVFINPLSWLKKSHSLHTNMLEKHIIWLKLWDNSQSKCMINADIPISLYILQHIRNNLNKHTEITSILKRRSLTTTTIEYLNPTHSIPLAFHNIFNKLATFIEEKHLQLEYRTKTVKSSGIKTKIPAVYTLADGWAVDTYTIKDGIMVKPATEIHPDANKRKLIVSNKASFAGAFIDEGTLGLTGNDKSYIIGDNLEIILKLLNFKISSMISHYTKYRQDFLEKEVYTYLPDIRKLGITDISEEEFYALVGFTEHEKQQIKQSSA